MKYRRRIRYYYLRFIRLRGEPHELALGLAFGVFTGMMPIMPFQIALSVTLALIFKGSKIMAALGTWISNPLTLYLVYSYSYRIGASLMGLSLKSGVFASVMSSIHRGDNLLVVSGKIVGAGGAIISSFLIGGLLMGVAFAIPSYFIFLKVFQFIAHWRIGARDRRRDERNLKKKKEWVPTE